MKTGNSLYRITVTAALALVALTGCDGQVSAPQAVAPADAPAFHSTHVNAIHDAEVASWLAGLRQSTAAFQQIDVAAKAGWDAAITGCMELPGTGGMGYHYGNTTLIDGLAEEFAPELLVYEPLKNGQLRLVAVEYIIPYAAWSYPSAPALHGVDFHRNDAFGLWVLHAWIWKHNPAGIFADWNPDVSCTFAP